MEIKNMKMFSDEAVRELLELQVLCRRPSGPEGRAYRRSGPPAAVGSSHVLQTGQWLLWGQLDSSGWDKCLCRMNTAHVNWQAFLPQKLWNIEKNWFFTVQPQTLMCFIEILYDRPTQSSAPLRKRKKNDSWSSKLLTARNLKSSSCFCS